MPVNRGDVILAYVANVGSPGGKVSPALVVPSDPNHARLNETILAAIPSNISRVQEASQLFSEVATPDGAASGLLHDAAMRAPAFDPAGRRAARPWQVVQRPPAAEQRLPEGGAGAAWLRARCKLLFISCCSARNSAGQSGLVKAVINRACGRRNGVSRTGVPKLRFGNEEKAIAL